MNTYIHQVPRLSSTVASHSHVDSAAAAAAEKQTKTDYDHDTDARSANLQLQTDLSQDRLSTASIPRQPAPSILTTFASEYSSHVNSPGSIVSSPQLSALGDITPLPSPIIVASSSPTRRPDLARARSSSAGTSISPAALDRLEYSHVSRRASPPKRKQYPGLSPASAGNAAPRLQSHRPEDLLKKSTANSASRSVSEYVPDAVLSPKPRNVTVMGSGIPSPAPSTTLHREDYLAVQRGIAPPESTPLTPPRSTGDYDSSDTDVKPDIKRDLQPQSSSSEIYTANLIPSGERVKYQAVRFLGQGAFSKVVLALQMRESADGDFIPHRGRAKASEYFAIKLVQHAPAGGADEERVEVSLQREVEILKSIKHPSLANLRAFANSDELGNGAAMLVLDYCSGGDLFELASQKLDLLVPGLIRRIFSELVSATRYLHQNWIVHRDLKLENVLMNIPPGTLHTIQDWQTFPRPVITVIDLGLSRRIPQPPESPLLTTRCGSEDYTAPEILMGQPYDGRATDAWALGVLLYSIMEGRLPFDALPGAKGDPEKLRARTPHRIARCEWAWFKYGDEWGEWDAEKGKEVEGAQKCVDGLLRRASRRLGLDVVAEMEWVKGGCLVQGGVEGMEKEMGAVVLGEEEGVDLDGEIVDVDVQMGGV